MTSDDDLMVIGNRALIEVECCATCKHLADIYDDGAICGLGDVEQYIGHGFVCNEFEPDNLDRLPGVV